MSGLRRRNHQTGIDQCLIQPFAPTFLPFSLIVLLFPEEHKDWHPAIGLEKDFETVTVYISDCFLKGKIIDKKIHVSEINWSGDCSGTAMHWILEPALKHSTGTLIVSCVWENGDSINRLECRDGDVKWVDVEI